MDKQKNPKGQKHNTEIQKKGNDLTQKHAK
jgi:hypothetical protein